MNPEDRARTLRHPVATDLEKTEIKKRLRGFATLSFLTGLPGLAAQVAGKMMMRAAKADPRLAEELSGRVSQGLLIALIGTALLITGLGFSAKAKGRSAWWGLMGFLSCLGLVVLYFLPKECLRCGEPGSYSAKQCRRCESPL